MTSAVSESGPPEPLIEVPLVRETFVFESGEIRRTAEFSGHEHVSSRESITDTGDFLGDWWKAYLRTGIRETGREPTLRAIDVFSGAGGLTLGLRSAAEDLGFRVEMKAAVDVDREALEVHRFNHGTERLITRSADLLVDSKVVGVHSNARFKYDPEPVDENFEELVGQVDVIVAGPPCQGHSSLNNFSRHQDDRNALYLTVPAMAVALQIPMVVIENVPGVVRDRSAVVQSAEQLLRASGYRVTTAVLAAQRLGWPQTRKRFFMVATLGHEPVPLAAQARSMEREALSLRWAIGDLQGREEHPLLDGVPVYTTENLGRMAYLIDQDATNLPLEIRPKSHQAGTTYSAVYGRMSWDAPAPTLTTGFSTPGRGRFTHPSETRTLTAREAARIQGFPDDYFAPEVLASVAANRSHITKWVGDAVPMAMGHVACLSALAPLLDRK